MQAAFQDFGASQGPRFRWQSRVGLRSTAPTPFLLCCPKCLPCKGLLALYNELSPLRSCCGGAEGTNFHLTAFLGLWHPQVLASSMHMAMGQLGEAPKGAAAAAVLLWCQHHACGQKQKGCRRERQGGVLGFVPCWELFWLNMFPCIFSQTQ